MSATRYYWWIVAICESKPMLIFGSDRSEDEARQKGMELLAGTNFEIKKLPTRDQGRASALLRGKRLEDTHDLKTASQRLGHEKSIARIKRLKQLRHDRVRSRAI